MTASDNFHGEYHIVTDPQVQPVIHAPMKCPILFKNEIKNCLDEMVENGVIRKVDEPTDWVNSLAYSRKQNGKLCLDPKDLNKAIKRCHHHTPTLEEITHQFAGSQHFSKLDAKNGYWSVKLDTESAANNLQFAIWKVLLPAYALRTSDVPRRFPATDGPDPGEMPSNPWIRG